MRRRLDYFCMQPTREGQASYAHVNEIIAGLRRRGWQVRLIEPPHPRPGRFDGMRRAFWALRVQASYWLRCRFRPAPFIYARSHFLLLPTAILARLTGTLTIQELNGPLEDAYDAWPALRRLHRVFVLQTRLQLRWANAVITVTPGLVDHYARLTGRSDGYHVIGNGADVSRFAPGPDPGPNGRRYVVFVGALASWQGIDVVLAALGSGEWPQGIDLVIAGDGKERAKVVDAQVSDERIKWHGSVPYRDVPALIAGSLAALVPMVDLPRSQTGLSPLKLFEAMASGVPVVASDLPGLGDLVRRHECGVVVPPGDAAAIARAVAVLAADPERASEMGSRGRAAVVGSYSWDVRAGETEQVLIKLAGGTERP